MRTTGRVARPDRETIEGDHETRIRDLERWVSQLKRTQAKWCGVEMPAQNITSQRTPWTVLALSTLSVSDPAYFTKSATANALTILKKGLYNIEITVREIYNDAIGEHNNAVPRQVVPVYSSLVGEVGRYWDGDVVGGSSSPEYGADNSFEGQPIAAGLGPFNDPFLSAEWAARYSAWFVVDGTLIVPPIQVRFAYRQLSGATQTVSALSRAGIVYHPSDVESPPDGYGTDYDYP